METDWLLSQAFLESHPRDGARILERIPVEEAGALLEKTSPPLAARVLQQMAPLGAAGCFAHLSPACAAAVLSALPLNAAAGLLRRLNGDAQDRSLEHVPTEFALLLQRLLRYPEGTAGALMQPRALALPGDVRVSEARTRVRRALDSFLYYLYVLDRERHLIGVLNVRELMRAPSRSLLSSVMRSHVLRLPARADLSTIVAHPGWRDFHVLPVVDDGEIFVGVIRYETLRRLEDAAARPAGEAISTMVSLGELCWIGLTEVLAGVAATMLPRVVLEDKETDDGSNR